MTLDAGWAGVAVSLITLSAVICLHFAGERSADRRQIATEQRARRSEAVRRDATLTPFIEIADRLEAIWSSFLETAKIKNLGGEQFVEPPFAEIDQLARRLGRIHEPAWFDADVRLALEDLALHCDHTKTGLRAWLGNNWRKAATDRRDHARRIGDILRSHLQAAPGPADGGDRP